MAVSLITSVSLALEKHQLITFPVWCEVFTGQHMPAAGVGNLRNTKVRMVICETGCKKRCDWSAEISAFRRLPNPNLSLTVTHFASRFCKLPFTISHFAEYHCPPPACLCKCSSQVRCLAYHRLCTVYINDF